MNNLGNRYAGFVAERMLSDQGDFFIVANFQSNFNLNFILAFSKRLASLI